MPKIAEYPFTTIEPVLGVVEHRDKSFVMVDIPGLIEGAHDGVGLGLDFLRHVERTRLLVHLVDGTADDPIGDYRRVRKEIELYDGDLLRKAEVVVVTKMDITGAEEKSGEVELGLGPEVGEIYRVSAAARQGLEKLLDGILVKLSVEGSGATAGDAEDPEPIPVLRPHRLSATPAVRKEGDTYVVSHRGMERFAAMVDTKNWNAMVQLLEQLRRAGVIDALEKNGVQLGDMVRIGDLEWEWE